LKVLILKISEKQEEALAKPEDPTGTGYGKGPGGGRSAVAAATFSGLSQASGKGVSLMSGKGKGLTGLLSGSKKPPSQQHSTTSQP